MREATRTILRRPGRGLLIAGLLLLMVELWLHTDGFLHRYRSVFAAGRALDKTMHVEAHCPALLIIGNSRVDNGFDPLTVAGGLDFPIRHGAFNLGIPGADTRVLAGIVNRIDESGCLQADGIRHVVLSLDEALVQSIDTLGQEVFFGNVAQMLADGEFHDALRATFRVYGYTTNFRQLREPGTLQRFVRATLDDMDPVGGSAAAHLGYRAGTGRLQDAEAVLRQEAGSLAPPSYANVQHLWRILDLLAGRGVRVAVVFPPLLSRDVLYLAAPSQQSLPYLAIADELRRRDVPMLALDDGPPRDPSEFVNAGHLNDKGAQRYSTLLGAALNRIWRSEPAAVRSSGRRADAS